MNFIEICNSDTRNKFSNTLNIWQKVQIIDLSTYVTVKLPVTHGFDKEKTSCLFITSFYDLIS
jgi:hypothetical protein